VTKHLSIVVIYLVGRLTLVGKASVLYINFSFFLSCFYQSTALSSRAVDGHHMYFGDRLGRGKASTIGIEISPTPPLIFTGGVKNAKCGVVFNITQL